MQSLEEIYREHAKTVYRYLLSITHNPDLSEELTQETFYQAIRSIERFDGSCKITTWLCAIAKNSLMSYQRKHPEMQEWNEAVDKDGSNRNTINIRTVVKDTCGIQGNSAENEVLSALGHVELLRKLHCLTADVREVMYLRLLGNLSFKEIGDILSKTENWARVTYYRGREKLKKEIGADE